jgi:peptide/nickel transport system permease protein
VSLLAFLLRRLAAIPLTFLIITAVLYGIIMLAPPEARAELYLPPNIPRIVSAEKMQNFLDRVIAENGLDDPYPQQYVRWLGNLLRGDWGYSPVLNTAVLPALIRRTPVTAELTLYSVLVLIPLGLLAGVIAGWREGSKLDRRFRGVAFLATSIPPFILGLVLLSVFYVGLRWFPPGRTSIIELSFQRLSTFQTYTGLLTVDGLLNRRPDVTIDALRHLVLPVFALSLVHWATLGRVTRAAMIEVKNREYIIAANARGLRPRSIVWRHAFRNALSPALTSSILSAASLVTGVFIIEVIFNLKGLSELIVLGMGLAPDSALAMGFAVYSILLVLPLMLVLDLIRVLVDPYFGQTEEP